MTFRSIAKVTSTFVAALVGLAGCTADAPLNKIGSAYYELGCERNRTASPPIQCSGGDRTIDGENGEDGITVACKLTNSSSGSRQLDLQILRRGAADAINSVQIINARFNDAGGLTNSGSAFLEVVDGGNRFRGTIGANTPIPCDGTNDSTCQPCRVSDFTTTQDSAGSKYVEVKMLCDGLPRQNDPRDTREITDQTASTEPATFRVYFCEGL